MAQALPLPERIGRYQIVSEIGRGAMGRVFLALDPVIERHVALKLMASQAEFDSKEWEEAQERFLLEARAAGRLKHPGVVTIFDADRDRETDTAYIAMEFVEGQSLGQLLKTCAPLRSAQALPVVEQVALALHAAHENDLVHRDVKPANILIDKQGIAKLTDFGITKFRAHSLTAAGKVLGSPSYMSPEQVRGEEIDGRADLFALGVVLYECLTGVLPFEGASLATVTYNILEVDPLSDTEIRSMLGPEVVDVVRRSIQKSPANRFQSGYEFAQALRATQLDSPSTKGPQGTQMLAGGSAGQAHSTTGKQTVQVAPHSNTSSKSLAWLLALVVIVTLAVGIPKYRSQTPSNDPEPRPSSIPTVERISTPQTPGPNAGGVLATDTEPASQPAAIASSWLTIRYKNRLKAGRISIWVDGERLWSRALNLRGGFVKQTSGEVIVETIPMTPGKHTIEVRITGAERKVDVGKKIEGIFRDNTPRVLQIGLFPTIKNLKLSWKE